MKRTCLWLLLTIATLGGISFGLEPGDYSEWATGGGYAAEYWGAFESKFNGYVQLGATISGGQAYDIRTVLKFDISDLTAGETVVDCKIIFLHEGGVLSENENVIISVFPSTTVTAQWNDFFNTSATDSKTAFAADAMGTYDGSHYYLVEVDVTEWVQDAVDNQEDVFAVRLSTPYLLEAGALNGKTLPYVRWLGATGTGVWPAALSYTVRPISKGHRVLMKHGLQIQALSSPWQSGFLDSIGIDTWEDSYFTTVSCNAHPNYSYQTSHTNTVPWDAMSYAEGGVYSLSSMGVPAALKETLVGIQIGDEQSIAVTIPQARIDAFATERAAFPKSLMYCNNNPLYNLDSSDVHTPITLSMLGTYMSAVNPDMLCFTEYAMCFQGTDYVYDYEGGSPTMMYEDLELYRDAGLAGVDGTGANPIPVGCWIQNFIWDHPHTNRRIMSGSEVRLAQFAPWTFGFKLVKAFVYGDHTGIEPQYQIMFEHDENGLCDYDSPEDHFYSVAETNRQSGNLGDSLVRLINYGVYMKLGLHEDSSEEVVSNSLPSGVSEWTYGCGADPYITYITVANLGAKNNGDPGDVILGLFKPLDSSLVPSGHEDDTYFMVTNGLTDATGTAVDCSLRIRIDFDFQSSGITRLLRKSRDTGEVEVVNLTPHLYPGQYYLLFDLDGGTGDLFKFDNGHGFLPNSTTSP